MYNWESCKLNGIEITSLRLGGNLVWVKKKKSYMTRTAGAVLNIIPETGEELDYGELVVQDGIISSNTSPGIYIINVKKDNIVIEQIIVTIEEKDSSEIYGYYGWVNAEDRDNLEEFSPSLFTTPITTQSIDITDVQAGKSLIIAASTATEPECKQIQGSVIGNLGIVSGTDWEVNETITKDDKIWYIWINDSIVSDKVDKITITF